MGFLFNPPETEIFQNQKDCFLPDMTQVKEIQKSISLELHKWSENMVNVENCQCLMGNFEGKFLSVIYLSEMKTACSITPSFFWCFFSHITDCLYHFLFWRYLNSSMVSFSSDHLLPFPNSNDLSSCALSVRFFQSVCNVGMVFKVSLHSQDRVLTLLFYEDPPRLPTPFFKNWKIFLVLYFTD